MKAAADLEAIQQACASRLSLHIEHLRNQRDVSLPDHIRSRRTERAAQVASRIIVYLDTNAWKCLADCRRGKKTLTKEMVRFGEAIARCRDSGRFLFPIGLPTFFELDSMEDPETQAHLQQLTDELSQGYCSASFMDQCSDELHRLVRNDFRAGTLEDFLRSPVELLGVPVMDLPPLARQLVDDNTFNKAFFDTLLELPFSVQLALAASAPGKKWDNSSMTATLNEGKVSHQGEITNLNTAVAIELRGLIDTWCATESIDLDSKMRAVLVINALHFWRSTPESPAFPTLRVLASLYGLMRFDQQRRYKDGDPADFLTVASALPFCAALFTDRRTAGLLGDPRLSFEPFQRCTVRSGFGSMAEAIDALLAAP